MDMLVLKLCGLWFWLTRKSRAVRYGEVAVTLNSAIAYLRRDYASRASTLDRGGFLLPGQLEAITLLERHVDLIHATIRRFESLPECCRFVSEELMQLNPIKTAPARRISIPVLLPFRASRQTAPVDTSAAIAEQPDLASAA